MFCHSTGYLRNRGGAGDFHRPYEGSETVSFYHSTGDTPSVTPVGRASSLREGAGNGCGGFAPFTRVLANIRGWRAIFIAPTKLRGGYIPPFTVPPKNRERAGDFHRPYEGSEDFTFYHSGKKWGLNFWGGFGIMALITDAGLVHW